MKTNRLLSNIDRALGGKRRSSGRATMPMFIGDYAQALARRYGAGNDIQPPLEVWYVQDTGPRGKPERVKIIRVRGSSDYYHRSPDYADVEGMRRTIGTMYMFPVGQGYSKPQYALITDRLGKAHNWVSIPRGWNAEKALQHNIEVGK